MGIFLSVVLTVTFFVLAVHSIKYIKQFAIKVKVIINKADDKETEKKQFNWEPNKNLSKNKEFKTMERIYKNEIKKSRSADLFNIWGAYLKKYDHLVYYPFRNRRSDRLDLLKPKSTFYVMLVVCSLCICWISSVILLAFL